jgi:hypothetical protein
MRKTTENIKNPHNHANLKKKKQLMTQRRESNQYHLENLPAPFEAILLSVW